MVFSYKFLFFNSPFKLSKPKEGKLKKNRKPINKGGDWGNRKSEINDLINSMI